mmetsp:Transcript_51984/g.153288  ORF Transcript_51984/g.153288 Transcript_51984/m.153288 type:complete len:625 (-) Transcript_51984:115-1989(-)
MAPKKAAAKEKAAAKPAAKAATKKSGGEISASVEESNELRAKLGIKPLKTDDDKETLKGTSNDPVHAPGGKRPDAPEPEPDEKEIKAAKKANKLHKDLVSGESLGDQLAREGQEAKGSASDWVLRTRNKDGTMKGAAEAKAAATKAENAKKNKALDAEVKVGAMKVRHDQADIQTGEEIIMTLSDSKLIDQDGKGNWALQEPTDELSNVNLLDAEKAKHNDAIRNQKEYDATKEDQDILEKYDELKTGPTGFIVGGQAVGPIGETDPEKRLALLTKISEQQTAEMKLKMQSDYMTSEEADAKFGFKKAPKKKGKKRKEVGDKDDHVGDLKAFNAPKRPEDAGSDEEDPELYESLSKQRRLVKRSTEGALKKGEAALAGVSDMISKIASNEDEDAKEEKEKIILGGKAKETDVSMTATTEFCNIVQTPIEKMDTMKHEAFKGSTLYKQQATARKGIAAGERKARRAGLTAAEAGEGVNRDKQEQEAAEEEIETLKEDGLDLSCASGLEYLRARSQIGIDQETHKNRKSDNRPLEMSTVDGDIKLEYRDDFGRVQTPKEAFRAISWKFHGKTPGRKNMERRLLRLENEMRLKSMDPMEQLPTLRALRHVQTADAKPYMVLSGANEK